MGLENLENIISDLTYFSAHDEIKAIVEANQDELVELQREQLSEGIDITGNERDDQYAPITIDYKLKHGIGLGAETDHVTFYMTGQLYASLYYAGEGDEFTIMSPLETYDKMVERITDERYGLSPEQRLSFAENKVLPAFAEILFEKTTFKL